MLIQWLVLTVILAAPVWRSSISPAIEAAQMHFEAGHYDEAIKTLVAVHGLTPDDPAVDYWLERSYYEKQNYDEAITYGERAVKTGSQNAEYYRWLGRAYGAKAEQSHSFFLARKVKKAFETAVELAPSNIAARRDLIQYLIEAPWIVGGDKEKAKQHIELVTKLDSIQGRLARAGLFWAEKKWKDAELEYLAALDQHSSNIDAYIEAADFFEHRQDVNNLERVLNNAAVGGLRDPRVDYYRAVAFILRGTELPAACALLHSYVANVPERSDYPSHAAALKWLRAASVK
jgi:tetratricopeptide (TPR) repeat protein